MNIIRVLWGEPFEGSRWKKVMRANVMPLIRSDWTIDQTVFVFGKGNAEWLEDQKNSRCRIILVDENPWGTRTADWYDDEGKVWVRPWILKWDAIQVAQNLFGPIIYCDWDVTCGLRPDQIPLLRSLFMGKELLLSAFRYRRNQYRHRPPEGRKFAASGNWIYLSAWSDFPSQVIERMEEEGRLNWHDEQVMGQLLEERHGGWWGFERWLRDYESPVMIQKFRHCPWTLAQHSNGTITGNTPIPFTWRKWFWQG